MMVCIGDSITEGYWNYGKNLTPFTLKLQECFEKLHIHRELANKPSKKIQVINYGFSGIRTSDVIEKVTEDAWITTTDDKDILLFATLLIGLNDVGTIARAKSPSSALINWKRDLCAIIKNLAMRKVKQLYLLTLPICPCDEKDNMYHATKLKMNIAIHNIIKMSDTKPRDMKIILIDLANYTLLNYTEVKKQNKVFF